MRLLPVAILLFCQTAGATTMRPLSLEELAQGAALIVLGRVTEQQATWSSTRITTNVGVQVLETWAGPSQAIQTLHFETPGGVVGNLGQSVAGSPRFVTGRSYVLFLTRGANDELHCLGLQQGVLALPASWTPELSDSPLHRTVDPHVNIVGPSAPPLPSSLTALRQRVLELRNAQ